jgi:hypothetical protein
MLAGQVSYTLVQGQNCTAERSVSEKTGVYLLEEANFVSPTLLGSSTSKLIKKVLDIRIRIAFISIPQNSHMAFNSHSYRIYWQQHGVNIVTFIHSTVICQTTGP